MASAVGTPKALLADKGYDGDRFRESLLIRGILLSIPPRSNRKVTEHPADYRRYRDRNRVERQFGKLEQQRRIATGRDNTVLSIESFLNFAAARLVPMPVASDQSARCLRLLIVEDEPPLSMLREDEPGTHVPKRIDQILA